MNRKGRDCGWSSDKLQGRTYVCALPLQYRLRTPRRIGSNW